MTARHAAKTHFRLPSQIRALSALTKPKAVTVIGLQVAAAVVIVAAVFASPPALVASTTDTLSFLRSQRDACQVMLDSATGTSTAAAQARTRARNCITDTERAIAALLASPTPSPMPSPTASPTATPTASPTGSPSPAPSPTASPTPAPTTPAPSPTQSPTPAPTTPSPTPGPTAGGWPGPGNTGVPAGTTLTVYTGPCTITVANTVIDGKTVNCSLVIKAAGVTVTRSLINGTVSTDEATPYSFALTDTEVNAPVIQQAAVGTTHFSLLRVNVHGGALSVYCWAHCRIEDSWLHGQTLPAGANWHLGALRADENDDPHNDADPAHDAGVTDLVAVHNSIACDVPPNSSDGGCSGGVTMYGDFGTVNHVTLDRNLLIGSPGLSYCLYGGSVSVKLFPNAHDIVVTNNLWQRGSTGKCGFYGPVSAYDVSAPGNVWSANLWDSGGAVAPAL